MLKSVADSIPGNMGRPAQDVREGAANSVFRVLHGYYGNMLFSKFASGKLDANGDDEGLVSARRVWDHGLQRYDAETMKDALRLCRDRHPEFPPSLPQFLSMCQACHRVGPRADATKLLGMGPKLRSVYAANARAIIEKHDARSAANRAGISEREAPPPTLDGLKQAIADASSLAGGNEAAELLRLDRMFVRGAVSA